MEVFRGAWQDPFQAEHGRTAVQPEAEAVAALAALVSAHTAGAVRYMSCSVPCVVAVIDGS